MQNTEKEVCVQATTQDTVTPTDTKIGTKVYKTFDETVITQTEPESVEISSQKPSFSSPKTLVEDATFVEESDTNSNTNEEKSVTDTEKVSAAYTKLAQEQKLSQQEKDFEERKATLKAREEAQASLEAFKEKQRLYLEIAADEERYNKKLLEVTSALDTKETYSNGFDYNDSHVTVTFDDSTVDIIGELLTPNYKIIVNAPEKEPQTFELPFQALFIGKEPTITLVGNRSKKLKEAILEFFINENLFEIAKRNLVLFNDYNLLIESYHTKKASSLAGFDGYNMRGISINNMGLACKRKVNKDTGEEELVFIGSPCVIKCLYREILTDRVEDELIQTSIEGNRYVLQYRAPSGDLEEVIVPAALAFNAGALSSYCIRNNIPLIVKNTTAFEEMLNAATGDRQIPIRDAVNRMGWVNETTYVNGQDTYSYTGDDIVCSNMGLRQEYHKRGTLEKHLEGMRGLMNIDEVRLFMGVGVAAILLHKTGIAPFSINLWGKSSMSKSTRVRLMLALTGFANAISVNMNSSAQAPNKHLEMHRDTAVHFDEVIMSEHGEDVDMMVKNTSFGTSRSRFNVKDDENKSKPICTIAVYTSEDDLFTELTADGTMARCIQMQSDKDKFKGLKPAVKEFERLVSPIGKNVNAEVLNYGHFTEPIIAKIFEKMDSDYSLNTFKDEVEAEFNRRYPASNNVIGRIGDMQVAMVMGLIIIEEILAELKGTYTWIESMNPYEVVYNLTAEHVEEAQVSKDVERVSMFISMLNSNQLYFDEPEYDENGTPTRIYSIKGYEEMDGKYGRIIYVPIDVVKKYCKDNNNMPYNTFKKNMRDMGILKTDMRKNGKPDGYTVKNPRMKSKSPLSAEYFGIIVSKVEELFPRATSQINDEFNANLVNLEEMHKKQAQDKYNQDFMNAAITFYKKFNEDANPLEYNFKPLNKNVKDFYMMNLESFEVHCKNIGFELNPKMISD